jgi:hypothetical protein
MRSLSEHAQSEAYQKRLDASPPRGALAARKRVNLR